MFNLTKNEAVFLYSKLDIYVLYVYGILVTLSLFIKTSVKYAPYVFISIHWVFFRSKQSIQEYYICQRQQILYIFKIRNLYFICLCCFGSPVRQV